MARAGKISNKKLQTFERKASMRREAFRDERVYFLIVCEGTKTEPLYFEALKKELPPHTIDLRIVGEGKVTQSLVNKAKELKAKADRCDSAWVVFDYDDFKTSFDNAIQSAAAAGIKCAWSNEAFELWYLLHFQHVNHAMNRKDYSDYLEKELKKLGCVDFKYEKRSTEVYGLLKQYGNEQNALRWAEALDGNYLDEKYSKHNPCTKVYKLIQELRNPSSLLQ